MVTVLEDIKVKIKQFKGKPKKILIPFKDYNKMFDEEELTSGFCTKHKMFLGHDNLYCFKCKSEKFSVTRELPFIEIVSLPFEVTSKVNEVTII